MDFTITGLWHQMSAIPRGVVILLLAMSVYAIAVAIERLFAFRRGHHQSIGYIGALQPLVGAPGRLREAVGLERRWRASPVARVIGSGITEFVWGMERLGPRLDATKVESVVSGAKTSMERVKERELTNLRRGLPGLATISSSAPFVGLCGTVFGIITAFRKMSDSNAPGGLASVSAGIAEALVTTAVGLAVAIVAVWFYNFFTTKVDLVTVDVEETAGEVLAGMKREGDL
jgi:biopolymer transport protein ExbB/TolQ